LEPHPSLTAYTAVIPPARDVGSENEILIVSNPNIRKFGELNFPVEALPRIGIGSNLDFFPGG
jgi:hypothetical protein